MRCIPMVAAVGKDQLRSLPPTMRFKSICRSGKLASMDIELQETDFQSSREQALAEDALGTDPSVLAKRMIDEALAPVRPCLDQLEKKICSYLPMTSSTATQVVDHVFASGGKRIRPALFYFCCDLFKYDGEHRDAIAAVCEYVHTASLLHDDVVDSSTLRRNKPTPNSLWGDQASVLVGDLIYSRASELMAATGSLRIVDAFAAAIRHMSEGELLQLENVFRYDVTEAEYFAVIERKTAALIAASCKSAALLAEGDGSELADVLAKFGERLGIAFQLIDDALDYLGDRELFGKQTGSDLLEGKITLPLILMRQRCTEAESKQLQQAFAKATIGETELEWITGLIQKYDAADAVIERAQVYTDEAIALLQNFPPSREREQLETLAKRLVWRFH